MKKLEIDRDWGLWMGGFIVGVTFGLISSACLLLLVERLGLL